MFFPKMSDNDKAVGILASLDDRVIPKVKRNAKVVAQFIEELEKAIGRERKEENVEISIMHGGSTYEGLAVKEKVDFDILLLLGKPFVSENFEIQRDPNSGYFTLQWKSHVVGRKWEDSNRYLLAQDLQKWVFGMLTQLIQRITQLIQRITLPNAEVKCRDGLAALDVSIKTEGREISLHLAPQISCHSWGQCPDLKPLGDLPRSLRCYIDTLNKNASPVMFFSPAVAGNQQNAHRLLNVSFSQLEKKFVTSNTAIRDMVRLVKYVAEGQGWKKNYGLKSFCVKRVAIKYADALENLNLWEGYRTLLWSLSQELAAGNIDGYFVRNQVTMKKKPENIQEFQVKIGEILRKNALESLV